MKKSIKLVIQFVVLFIAISAIGITIILAAWYFKTNDVEVNPAAKVELWDAVTDDGHNFNTDLLLWNDHFYLIYQHSKTHFFDGDSKLVLLRSKDCKKWEKLSEIKYEELEFRDPKLAVINNIIAKRSLFIIVNTRYLKVCSQLSYLYAVIPAKAGIQK